MKALNKTDGSGPVVPASEGFRGGLAVLVRRPDGGDRGRGILFRAARDVRPEDVVIMAGCGGICTVTVNEPLAMRLGLVLQTRPPQDATLPYRASSIEAATCSETGISAAERALTLRTIGSVGVRHGDVVSPGHIMVEVAPNILRDGASLSELANLFLASSTDIRYAAWSDILNADGELAGAEECLAFAVDRGLDAYDAADVSDFGRQRLKPWIDAVEFSRSKFGE